MADPKVCVTLDGTDIEQIADEAARANLSGADMVELRFDRLYLIPMEPVEVETEDGELKPIVPPEEEWARKNLEDIDVEATITQLKERIPLPVIFTVRGTDEGGFFPGTEKQRLAILESAIASKVSWIDIELEIDSSSRDSLVASAKSNGINIIGSKHDVEGTPSSDEILELVQSNVENGDIIKFCSTINDHQDALQIVEACQKLKETETKYALMGVGNGGDWARLHAPVFGQELVYASLSTEHRLSNKGLVNVRDLKDAWVLLEY
ncbi:MAG: type I 3-dehydroquinate dehydratase [Candidatus Poseidoniales archaeon]